MKFDNQRLFLRKFNLVILIIPICTLIVLAFWPSLTVVAATPEPDRVATGVMEAKAIAATLTAEAPVIDRIATGVMEAKSIAATLTAEIPQDMETCEPCVCPTGTKSSAKIVTPTETVSSIAGYGPTKHCDAKSGYATIELRNIVANVKSLNFFVDGVQVTSVAYGKYGCIYLEDGKYVFQWKNDSQKKQSNARSFTVKGSDGWYTDSKRPDGIRNPYDAWLDKFIPTDTATPEPTPTPTLTP